MSIEKVEGGFALACDICGDYEVFDSFKDAVKAKKELGWFSQKTPDGWEDFCAECVRMGDES